MSGEGEPGREKTDPAETGPRKLDRRDVLMGLSTVPALGLFGYAWHRHRQHQQGRVEQALAAAAAPADLQQINVALLGAGAQGQVLTDAMLRIPGLRFRAVCDIWTEYNLRRVVNTLKRFKQEVNGYQDYREMLDKEKDVDAVVSDTIHRGNPVGFLGMVLVLEGTSVQVATRAAQALKDSLRLPDTAFSYLTSHGALDVGHTKFFETLVNRLQDPADREQVIHCARIFYRLYGDIFRALAGETGVVPAITEAA